MFYKSKVSCLMGGKKNFFLKIKYKKCDKKNRSDVDMERNVFWAERLA